MPDYSNSKIYKLVCNKTGLQYIGSTTASLCARKFKHKADFIASKNGKKKNSITSFLIIENEDYDIILIEQYPCKTKEELLRKERFYIETLECVNKVIPIISKEERNQKESARQKERHDEKYEYNKQYRKDNFEHIANYMHQYYETNKEYKQEYDKQYREEHKEQRNEYSKKYYEENKDQVKRWQTEKIDCDCGGKYTRSNKASHLKTKLHQEYLKN